MIKREQVDSLLESIKAGLNISDSCALAGISRVTYYAWLKKTPGFKGEVEKARLTLKKAIIETILNQAKDDWRAGMTYLERVYREEFHVATGAEKDLSERLDTIEEKLDQYLDAKTKEETNGRDFATP